MHILLKRKKTTVVSFLQLLVAGRASSVTVLCSQNPFHWHFCKVLSNPMRWQLRSIGREKELSFSPVKSSQKRKHRQLSRGWGAKRLCRGLCAWYWPASAPWWSTCRSRPHRGTAGAPWRWGSARTSAQGWGPPGPASRHGPVHVSLLHRQPGSRLLLSNQGWSSS